MPASRVRKLRVAIIVITSLLALLFTLHKLREEPTVTLSPLYTSEPAGAERVLFIGNSHTFTHDIPHMVQRINAAQGGAPPLWVGTVLAPGATLSDLRERSTKAHKAQTWTFTVIQPSSLEMFRAHARTEAHGRALIDEARAHGSQAVWFELWPRSEQVGEGYRDGVRHERASPEAGLAHMRDTTSRILSETSARRASVVQSWQLAQTRHPNLQLYARDGYHASPEGAYLAALTLHATLRGTPATPGPAMWHPDEISPETALALQHIAAEAHLLANKN